MKIILNRDIRGLGKAGEICVVRDGYGRNFLLPKGYAIIANKANVAIMEQKLAELKANNEKYTNEAQKVASILENEVFNVVRQASDDDIIYGSVRVKDIYNLVLDFLKNNNVKFDFDTNNITIENPIRSLGKYLISINLFGDVVVKIRLNVCRTSSDFESDPVAFDRKMNESLAKDENNKVVASKEVPNKKEEKVEEKQEKQEKTEEVKEEKSAE